TQLGGACVSHEPYLLQHTRSRRPLRRLGTARPLRRRDAGGLQNTALAGHRRAGRAPRAPRHPRGTGRSRADIEHREGSVMTAFWRTPAGLHFAAARLPDEGQLPSFDGATGWLNSPPLTPDGLRGKVVLIDFWTYTCINWLRQLPYLRAWAAKYSDHGLVVIGVHTPEFSFEQNPDNVRQAVQDMKITYPVATDNNYGVWLAFDNHYWPALYFADAQGRLRHHHFGEGDYGRSEMVLQQLLGEAGSTGAGTDIVSVDPTGLEA